MISVRNICTAWKIEPNANPVQCSGSRMQWKPNTVEAEYSGSRIQWKPNTRESAWLAPEYVRREYLRLAMGSFQQEFLLD